MQRNYTCNYPHAQTQCMYPAAAIFVSIILNNIDDDKKMKNENRENI